MTPHALRQLPHGGLKPAIQALAAQLTQTPTPAQKSDPLAEALRKVSPKAFEPVDMAAKTNMMASIKEALKKLFAEQGESQPKGSQTVTKISIQIEIEMSEESSGRENPWSAEAVGKRISDFAFGAFGRDPSKHSEMKAAIQSGYDEAIKLLGDESDLAKSTLTKTVEFLQALIDESKQAREQYAPVDLAA